MINDEIFNKRVREYLYSGDMGLYKLIRDYLKELDYEVRVNLIQLTIANLLSRITRSDFRLRYLIGYNYYLLINVFYSNTVNTCHLEWYSHSGEFYYYVRGTKAVTAY